MATHINITADTFAATYGITLGTGAEAESATATTTVAINELMDSATAEVIAAAPINHAEKQTQVDGEGPASLSLTAASASWTTVETESTRTHFRWLELDRVLLSQCLAHRVGAAEVVHRKLDGSSRRITFDIDPELTRFYVLVARTFLGTRFGGRCLHARWQDQ